MPGTQSAGSVFACSQPMTGDGADAMSFRFPLSGFARRFKADLRTLLRQRIRDGPSFSERALALDRLAGTIFLICIAGTILWLAGHVMTASLSQMPRISESVQADSGMPDPEAQEPAAAETAEPLNEEEIRKLQIWLMIRGFDPGSVDGVAGPSTLKAFNQYRASRHLNPISQIDRADMAELPN